MILDNNLYSVNGHLYRYQYANNKSTRDMSYFQYTAVHIPTGKKFTRAIWVYRYNAGIAILAAWNSEQYQLNKTWEYSTDTH
jgi:hypothetical protein